jgi:phenolic acid decarboxylase
MVDVYNTFRSIRMESSARNLDFVPHGEWPTIEQLAQGYDEYLMPQSSALTGRQFVFEFANGWRIDHKFVDATLLQTHLVEAGTHSGMRTEHTYRAFEVRPGIFFLTFFKEEFEEQVAMVLDTVRGRVLNAISGFKDIEGKKRTTTMFVQAVLAGFESPPPFEASKELVGKRVLYRYSPRDWYEHIYLNGSTFAWHCLSGVEQGLADTEQLSVYKVDEGCYVLTWSERVMPVESFIVTDLRELRSTGSFFCWDPKPAKAVRMIFGSQAEIINETVYPANSLPRQ